MVNTRPVFIYLINIVKYIINKKGINMIEDKLIKLLSEKNMTITTAESCTGGMISSRLVNVSGASAVLNEAYVTYSNEAKSRNLGVSKETIDKYGAVSEETAKEMVEGVAKRAFTDCAIAVTGIAGPDGGTKEKPVGTVYAGYYICGESFVERYNFQGDRYEIRKKTTDEVLTRIYKELQRK